MSTTTLHVYDAAREFPDRPALMVEGSTFTWEDLEGILAPMMIDLLDRGVYPGTHNPVSLVATNTLDTLQRVLCLITAGVPAQLIHPALTEPERRALLDTVVPIDAPDVVRDPNDPPMARGSLNFPDIDARDEHPLAIVYTSGTGGLPKGVILSRRAFVWSARASEKNLGWHDDDRWLLRIPIAHIGGLSTVTRCLLGRRCMVLGDDRIHVLEQIQRDRVTIVSLVPTLLRRLLDDAPDWRPPAHLRAVLLGGGPASPELLADAAERGWPVLTTYGLTEACSQVTTQRPGTINRGELGSGPPLPGVELRIEEEEIQVRGRMLFSGYLPTTGLPPLLPGGWYATGDRGRLDESGNLHVLGRIFDLIVSGGENVDPLEVENALRACPGVADACVFGVRDREWGERVVAAVVLGPGIDPGAGERARIATDLRARLAPFKLPRALAFVDRIPLTSLGKVDRNAAAHRFASRLEDVSYRE